MYIYMYIYTHTHIMINWGNMGLGFWHVPRVLWRWLDKFLALIISCDFVINEFPGRLLHIDEQRTRVD